jgi:hypothetical protein
MRSICLVLLLIAQESVAKGLPSRASLDRVVLETNDLDRAIRDFERRTGVKPKMGGSYGGRGYRNAIVGLGYGRFLEIKGPEPEGWDDDNHTSPRKPEAPKPPAPLKITPQGWVIATQDLSALLKKLHRRGFDIPLPPVFGNDSFNWWDYPTSMWDYQKSAWRWFQVYDFDPEISPVFIQWDRGTRLPSRSAPRGCTLQRLEIRTPQATKLRRLITILGVRANVTQGPKSSLTLSLNCPKGRISF